jgi:hypothetical protein
MGAAFMLYAQGLLPFLLPLSVLLFEADKKSRRRMLLFLWIGVATTLYILWALTAFPTQVYVRGNSIVYINQATNNITVAIFYVIATCGSLFFSKIKMIGLRRGQSGDTAHSDGVQAVCVHFALVRLRCDRQPDHPGILLEKQGTTAVRLRLAAGKLKTACETLPRRRSLRDIEPTRHPNKRKPALHWQSRPPPDDL